MTGDGTTPGRPGGSRRDLITESRRGDGRQRVFHVREDGVEYLEKHHGRKRGRVRSLIRSSSAYLLFGKSWARPRGCLRTESAVIELWRREGFDVPGPPPAPVEERGEDGALRMEWIPGESLARALTGEEATPERNEEILTRLGRVTRLRHDRAIELKEPRLVMEHASLDHILVADGRLAHIDFEIVSRRRGRVGALVRREMTGFLVSLYRTSRDLHESWIGSLIRGYDHRPRMEQLCRELLAFGVVPATPLIAPFLKLTSRSRRQQRKKLVGRALERALRAPPSEARAAPRPRMS